MTMAEAMALGKPVIATRVFGEPGVHGRREQLPRALRPRRRSVELVGICAGRDMGRAGRRCGRQLSCAEPGSIPTRRGLSANELAKGSSSGSRRCERLSSSTVASKSPNKRRDRRARVASRRAAGHPGGVAGTGRGLGGGPRRGPKRAADLARASVPPSSALAVLRGPAACRYGRPRCGDLVASLDPGPGTARAPARGLGQARRERAMTEAAQAVNERQSAPP